ncbi:MAG: TetR/AcrR family transcriptional regulator [Parvularculaceae bacterium]
MTTAETKPHKSETGGAAASRDPLDVAVELFRSRGYENASVEDLVKATGLNRYALYQRFGGKREVFLAALERFHRVMSDRMMAALSEPGASPLEAVRNCFHAFVDEDSGDFDKPASCLICNAAVEAAPGDAEIAARVNAYFDEIRQTFAAVLARAQGAGEARRDMSPQAGAGSLVNAIIAIGVQARAGASPDKLHRIVDEAISLLLESDTQKRS